MDQPLQSALLVPRTAAISPGRRAKRIRPTRLQPKKSCYNLQDLRPFCRIIAQMIDLDEL
jgi:hypothetical protein